MLNATQIILESTRPAKENIKGQDTKNIDEASSKFEKELHSTLEKIKDSKTSKIEGYRTQKKEEEDSLTDEGKKEHKKTIYNSSLLNLQTLIQSSMDDEISNPNITNTEVDNNDISIESVGIENQSIVDVDIATNTFNAIKTDEKNPQILDSAQDNEINSTSQEFAINTPNLDYAERQTDIQYIENYNEQISVEKPVEQKSRLDFLGKPNTEQLVNYEEKLDLKHLTKPEGQLEQRTQQLDEETISIHNMQEHNMQDINSSEDGKSLEELINNEGKIYTQELKTEQEEINQKTFDDVLEDNIELQFDNLNVIEPFSQQDSTLDFTKVLLSNDLTEKIELIDQLADKTVITFSEGNTELEIQVKPEHLGKLVLKVGLEDGVLTGKIYTANQEIKEFLQENLDVLRNSLREQGLVFASLDVDVGSQSNPNNFNYFHSTQSRSGKTNKFTNYFTIETENDSPTLQGSLSKIDYLA